MSRLPVEQWREAELSLYRRYTIELLRRYMRMSMELGRMPSIIGREFFRARVSSYRANSFEDKVILVHDVDRCLALLEAFDQKLIARIALQEYSFDEAAPVLGISRSTLFRRYPMALDALTEVFIKRGLLREQAIGKVTFAKWKRTA
jgi:DNA-directed RNA polymerase specialized sigma24 family protein